jgi:gliding motility-associated-like protein
MRLSILVAFGMCITVGLRAQPVNDECVTAIHLDNTSNWCSPPSAYSNVNGTPYAGTPPDDDCFLQLSNDVWFTFIPETPAMYIRVSGAVNGLGTLRNPGIAVFEGPCNNLKNVGCNITSASTNQVELSITDLIIGKVYYLVVEGQNELEGSFQVCLEGFIPPPSPQSDCSKAVVLCDKSQFVVDTLLGVGAQDPGVTNTCIGQEFSSAWYKWTCEVSGTLAFTLFPNNFQPGFESDDIDFVVYELPNGIEDCSDKIELRCMAAGANTNQPFQSWSRCNGPTGLRDGDPDTEEPPGCQGASQNNFVDAIDMVAGKSYALLVNNFSQSGLGFSIEWGGTGTFQGPDPGFDVEAVQAFECDKTIIFSNASTAPTDSIVSYLWNFGAGSNPTFDTTKGPVNVIYESFGFKKVALTVTSSKGCVVTEILDFFVEPCCADTSTLSVEAIVRDQICPNSATGVIQGVGVSGSPEYQYSLDCVNYQPASVFPFLMPGDYTLCIQDQKGCENQVDITVNPADDFFVEAGDTIFVQLGQTANLNAIPFPTLPTGVTWTNEHTLTFSGTDISSLLSPTALPMRTGWYVVTITNDAGCITSDSVLIVVDPYKPIYIPNVISANFDGINDELTVYGNNAAIDVGSFQIFDRWGNMLWERTNFELNDPSLGWDGTVNGKPVNPGVYTYLAVVNFLDEIPVPFYGTVTVLR